MTSRYRASKIYVQFNSEAESSSARTEVPAGKEAAATTIYEYTYVHVKAYGIQTKWRCLQA